MTQSQIASEIHLGIWHQIYEIKNEIVMKYSILAAALLLAACGGNGSDSTANTVEVVADDQPTATETSVAPTPTPEPGVSSQPEQIQQPTAPVAQPTIAAGPCVDTAPVGDGFGWNGVASCTLPVVEATPPLEPEAVPDMPLNVTTPVVADTRIGECVDEDGDGLGFDGFVSCRLSIASDPSWAYCETDTNLPDVELEFGQTWGKQRDRSDEIYPCVRRCGATAFELPNTPGWSYDPDAAAECIVDEDTNSDVFIELAENVPVYDIKSGATERQSFQDQFAYPLYYGDASWECSRETRQSNSEEFVAVGAPRNIIFDDTFFGNWYFDRRQWKQTLTINDNSDQDGLFEYPGYAQIEHDKQSMSFKTQKTFCLTICWIKPISANYLKVSVEVKTSPMI